MHRANTNRAIPWNGIIVRETQPAATRESRRDDCKIDGYFITGQVLSGSGWKTQNNVEEEREEEEEKEKEEKEEEEEGNWPEAIHPA